MNMFEELTDDNYNLYAAKVYQNPQCQSEDEFLDDLKRVHYIKKLLNKYVKTGELKTRLILNHLTLLHNVFGIRPAARLLFYKLDPKLYSSLKAFLVFKYAMPEQFDDIQSSHIIMDQNVINTLREI